MANKIISSSWKPFPIINLPAKEYLVGTQKIYDLANVKIKNLFFSGCKLTLILEGRVFRTSSQAWLSSFL